MRSLSDYTNELELQRMKRNEWMTRIDNAKTLEELKIVLKDFIKKNT